MKIKVIIETEYEVDGEYSSKYEDLLLRMVQENALGVITLDENECVIVAVSSTASIEIEKCQFDPTMPTYGAIGMFHCPECGEMVMAGVKHPDYSRLDEWTREPIDYAIGSGDNHNGT